MKNLINKVLSTFIILFLATGCIQINSMDNNNLSSYIISNRVFDFNLQSPSIVDVMISRLPTKLDYDFFEPINLEGGLLKITYDDETEILLPMTEDMLDFDSNISRNLDTREIFIKFESDGKSFEKSFNISIKPFVIPLQRVNIDVKDFRILSNQNFQVIFNLEPANATISKIEWISLNPEIATIDNDGLIIPSKDGVVKFNLLVDDVIQASLNVEVFTPARQEIYFRRSPPVVLPDIWKNQFSLDWYGDGSSFDYSISTALELSGLAHLVNYQAETFEGKTVTLTANIDLLNKEWDPIGNWDGYTGPQEGDKPFKGTFDGQDFVISNLKIALRQQRIDLINEKSATGLFGAVNGTLKNINLQTVNISGLSYVGALVGNLNGVAENIIINNAIISGNSYVGSVVGILQSATLNDITINNTIVNANFLNSQYSGDKAGGIAGFFRYSSISNLVLNNLIVTAEKDVGGVVGAAAEEDSDDTYNLIQNTILNNVKVEALLPEDVSRTPVGYAGLLIGQSIGISRINYYETEINNLVISYTESNGSGITNKIIGGVEKSFVLKNVFNVSKVNLSYYTSIQMAIDDAQANEIIKIGSGTFFEEVIFTTKNNITLTGVLNGTTIIAPSRIYILGNNGITIDNSQNITIRYITIDGYANPSLGSVPTFRDGVHYLTDSANHNNTFEYLIIKNIDRRGISIFPLTTTNTIIRNSTFDNITGSVMGTWNGSIGINFQGTGLVENNEVSNMHTGLIHNSNVANGIVTIRNNHFHTFKDSSLHQLGFFNAGINAWPRSTETMIIENNTISSTYSNQIGMILNSFSRTSQIIDNTIIIDGESVVGIDVLNNKNGGFEVSNNIISVGAYSTALSLSTVGTSDHKMQIDSNTITMTEPKSDLTIGYEFNDFFFYKTNSRAVGILLSGSNTTKRVKDTVGLRATYAVVSNNQITDFTIGIGMYSDVGFNSWESLIELSNNEILPLTID